MKTVHELYLRAAKRTATGRTEITGNVLHLPVWANEPGTSTGTNVPLCGAAHVEIWSLDGPWASGWQRHEHWMICRRCLTTLERLGAMIGQHADRLGEITDALEQLEPEPAVSPDCKQGKHTACTGGAWDMSTDSPVPCACCEAAHEPVL